MDAIKILEGVYLTDSGWNSYAYVWMIKYYTRVLAGYKIWNVYSTKCRIWLGSGKNLRPRINLEFFVHFSLIK